MKLKNLQKKTTKTELEKEKALTKEERDQEIAEVFNMFDKNGDGVLSYDEFRIGYTAMYGRGMQGMELENIIAAIDKDKSGKIEYSAFGLSPKNIQIMTLFIQPEN